MKKWVKRTASWLLFPVFLLLAGFYVACWLIGNERCKRWLERTIDDLVKWNDTVLMAKEADK